MKVDVKGVILPCLGCQHTTGSVFVSACFQQELVPYVSQDLQNSSTALPCFHKPQSTWRSSRNEPHLQQFFRNNSFITYALLEHRNLPNSASSLGNGWAAGDSVAISGIVKLDQNQTAVAPGPETISHLLPGRWSSSPSQGGTGMYRMHGRRMRMCLINLFSFPAQNI